MISPELRGRALEGQRRQATTPRRLSGKAQWPHRLLIIALSVPVLMVREAFAIPAQDLPAIEKRQDDIQRNQEDLLRRQEERRREFQDTPPDGFAPPQVEMPEVLKDGACMEITSLDVQGAKIIPADYVNVLTGEYVGRCLTLEHINVLLAEISNWYLDRGYVTTRAYLPPQDLSAGMLRIVVIEGRAEELQFRPEMGTRSRLATAFPEVKGDVLNIRDLEQGLDQLNRLPSNDAKLKLEPGAEAGGTVVVIENTPKKRWRLSYTEDNTGSKSTGVRQRTISVEADDVLGLNEAWTLDIKPDRSKTETSGTRTISGSLSIPYGYWTISYSDSWFTYYSTVQATTQNYRSTGVSRQRAVSVERVITRDQDSKTSVEGKLTHKATRNYIAGVPLETQSRELAIGKFTIHHSTKLVGGSLTTSGTYEKGLRVLGAKRDKNLLLNDPHAQFEKYSLSASYSRPFQVGQKNFNASISAAGQLTPQTLYGSERISVGGLSSVRGFKEEYASGDVGGYVRTELSWYPPQVGVELIDRVFGAFAPYAALDGGWIQSDPNEELEGGTLTGWAIGLRTYGGYLTIDVAWAEPISKPDYISRNAGQLYASVSMEY